MGVAFLSITLGDVFTAQVNRYISNQKLQEFRSWKAPILLVFTILMLVTAWCSCLAPFYRGRPISKVNRRNERPSLVENCLDSTLFEGYSSANFLSRQPVLRSSLPLGRIKAFLRMVAAVHASLHERSAMRFVRLSLAALFVC